MLLHRGAFTRGSCDTPKLLQRDACIQKRFYKKKHVHKKHLHRETCIQRSIYTEAPAHRSVYKQTLLHREAPTNRCRYTDDAFERTSFYAPAPLQREALLHTETF